MRRRSLQTKLASWVPCKLQCCLSLHDRFNRKSAKLTPLSASDFFSQALEVSPPGNEATFRVYLTPPEGQPGKGQNPNGTFLITHHGAGASGLSFAPLAKEVKARAPELGVLAFDARGHGMS
jgi:protein phosphatase methylesterase 1